MAVVLIILFLLCALYLLLHTGRTGHPLWSKLERHVYAHRGLHGNGIPENSMAPFRLAVEHGYGIELDVHLLKDGELAVIHDSALVRTTGRDGKVEQLTARELPQYQLEGTKQTIPLFSQVLELCNGKIPLIVELKPDGKNAAQLTETVCNLLKYYPGDYCLESFDPRCLLWLKKHRPELMRGQLSYDYFSKPNKLPWILKVLLKYNLLNLFSRPDFIAYKFCDRKIFSNFLCRRILRIRGVTWTIQTQEDMDTAIQEGWIPIFEFFTP